MTIATFYMAVVISAEFIHCPVHFSSWSWRYCCQL